MSGITTIGLDLAKNVFQVHGVDDAGRAILRKKLGRVQVLTFLGGLPPCTNSVSRLASASFTI